MTVDEGRKATLRGRLVEGGRRRLQSAFTSARYARDVEAIYAALA